MHIMYIKNLVYFIISLLLIELTALAITHTYSKESSTFFLIRWKYIKFSFFLQLFRYYQILFLILELIKLLCWGKTKIDLFFYFFLFFCHPHSKKQQIKYIFSNATNTISYIKQAQTLNIHFCFPHFTQILFIFFCIFL